MSAKQRVVFLDRAVDAAACGARGIAVRHLPQTDAPGPALIGLLEALVARPH